MFHRLLRGLAVAVGAGALLLGSATMAPATIVERERYSFEGSFPDEICGVDVHVDFEVSGVFMIRADKQDSPAFFASDNFTYRDVITNPATGKSIVVRGKGNFRDVKATHVEGDIFLFQAHLAGQHFVVEDSDGTVVYRERGLLVFEQLFDTLGDDVPGGEELSFELVAVRGHPKFIDDLCPLFHDLVG